MQEQKQGENKERKLIDDNIVFIGTKPFMIYITNVVMQFTIKNRKEVILKARGKFISKAVDIAEMVRIRFNQGTQIKDIKIGSEEVENKEGRKVNVSTIAITLTKQ